MTNEQKLSRGWGNGARKRILATALLALASLSATLGVLELGLRLLGYGAIYDVYSKPSLLWRHDPLLGWSHQPDSRGTYVGPRPWPVEFRTPIRINSQGLRGPEIAEPSEGGVRILFLGDSVVAAFEVAYESTFVALLGQRLQARVGVPVQTLNGGVRGYGTDQSYLFFRERGRLLHPDLVVFVHSVNDVGNNMTLHRMRRPFGKPAFALEHGVLSLRGAPVPAYPLCSAWMLDESYQPRRVDSPVNRAVCWLQTRLSDHFALFTFIGMRIRQNPRLLRRLYDLGSPDDMASTAGALASARASILPIAAGGSDPGPAQNAGAALTGVILRELAREVRAAGAEFALVIRDSEFERFDPDAMRDAGIRPIELVIELPKGEGGLSFEHDSHYNSKGHFLVARALTPVLTRRVEELLEARH